MSYVGILDFAEALGVQFEMDWDGEVSILYPDEIDIENLKSFLRKNGKRMADDFKGRASWEKHRFIGGPFDGRVNHAYAHWCRDRITALKYQRAKWAVYRQQGDGRAFFVGFAKSEKKARAGDVFEKARLA